MDRHHAARAEKEDGRNRLDHKEPRLPAAPMDRRGEDHAAPHRPAAPLMAQMIAQEVIGTGLHIEPWRYAMDAYGRAAASAA